MVTKVPICRARLRNVGIKDQRLYQLNCLGEAARAKRWSYALLIIKMNFTWAMPTPCLSCLTSLCCRHWRSGQNSLHDPVSVVKPDLCGCNSYYLWISKSNTPMALVLIARFSRIRGSFVRRQDFGLDWFSFLRQTVKTQNSANGMKMPLRGGLSLGFVSTAVHEGVQVGRAAAAGDGGVGGRGGAGL
jgi:hypothetical protein